MSTMKQRITQEQLDSLLPTAKQRYAKWCDPQDDLDWPWSSDGVIRKGKLPLLTIGQMIQFLDGYINEGWWHIERPSARDAWRVQTKYGDFEEDVPELCDALWEAVTAILEDGEE